MQKLEIDYDKVIEYSKQDVRLGNSYWQVPGPDGDFGFGGHCLPKDLNALIFAKSCGILPLILESVLNKNNKIRNNREKGKYERKSCKLIFKNEKVALITGVTGQDGAYLSEFYWKNYIVHGIKRRSSLFNTDRIDHIYQDPHIKDKDFILHYGDMTDSTNLIRLIKKIQPDEIYNLAAMSHVKVSFDI